SAIAAVLTRRRASRLRDSTGDHPADLKERPRGRRCADTKELPLLCARRYMPREKTENENSDRDRTAPPNAELSGHVSPARQQFRRTTWITPDCNNTPPADGRAC